MNPKRIFSALMLGMFFLFLPFSAKGGRLLEYDGAEKPEQLKVVEEALRGLSIHPYRLYAYEERHDIIRCTVTVKEGDVFKIADFLEKQSDGGNPYASVALAEIIMYGDYDGHPYSSSTGLGIEFDFEKCKGLLEKAAKSEDARLANSASFALALFKVGIVRSKFFTGDIRDYFFVDERGAGEIEEGMAQLVKCAKFGTTEAAEYLSLIYGGLRNKRGNFIRRPDERLEFYWLVRAAELGASAKNALEVGRRYLNGDGVVENIEKASQYFKLGAGNFEGLKQGEAYDMSTALSAACAEALAHMCDKKLVKSSDRNFSKKVRRKIETLNDAVVYRSMIRLYSGRIFRDPEMSEYWSKKMRENIFDKGVKDSDSSKIMYCRMFTDEDYTPGEEDIKLADSGDANSQLDVGMKLSQLYNRKLREGKFKDFDEIAQIQARAAKYLEAAAQAGNYEAQMRLCSYEYRSFIVNDYKWPDNSRRRLYWAEIAAKTGKGEALSELRSCYRAGLKKGMTKEDGTRLLEEASDRGDYNARWILRADYSHAKDGEDAQKYFYRLNKQCEIFCDSRERFEIGCLYFYGWGTAEDKAKGLGFIEDSAMGLNPHPRAMYFLRHIYKNGIFVKRDEKISERWLKKFKNAANVWDVEKLMGGAPGAKKTSPIAGKIFPIDEAAAKELEGILKDLREKERLMK